MYTMANAYITELDNKQVKWFLPPLKFGHLLEKEDKYIVFIRSVLYLHTCLKFFQHVIVGTVPNNIKSAIYHHAHINRAKH
jgi:hypothetical protein